MGGAQVMKRIPRIKFPQRHPKPSGSTSQPRETYAPSNAAQTLFSTSAPSNVTGAGKASLQPKRTPVSQEEIESILLGGCI
ncbi:Thioredoxin domain-containing protein [Actinidia chinensis var. chinensis]|uniref:Thioredoxin domain-containing protein n=1 Tax=Actinidia chinensis var. chinensis TaxID=1590841 RepID=A0A2R6QN15_ACTCC|nr:Thioredoxin domain-containing protein [Actinidia chinensis var. chinensis]